MGRVDFNDISKFAKVFEKMMLHYSCGREIVTQAPLYDDKSEGNTEKCLAIVIVDGISCKAECT